MSKGANHTQRFILTQFIVPDKLFLWFLSPCDLVKHCPEVRRQILWYFEPVKGCFPPSYHKNISVGANLSSFEIRLRSSVECRQKGQQPRIKMPPCVTRLIFPSEIIQQLNYTLHASSQITFSILDFLFNIWIER